MVSWLVGCVLLHVNACGLFHAKLYIYICVCVVCVWVMVIFRWVFFVERTNDTPKTGLGIALGCQRVYLLAFSSTMLLLMAFDKKKEVKVRSPDGDTDYFDIVAGVIQGDTLAPYLFIICLDYVLRTSIDKIKENGFKLTKERSRRYST